MKKNVFVFILIIALFFSFSWESFALEEDEVNSYSAVLIDADTQQLLYAKNMNEIREPASITKIITVYLAMQHLQGEEVFIAGQEVHTGVIGSTNINLKVNEEVRSEDLLYAAILNSANDACNVLAQNISGSNHSFTHLMNEFANEAKAYNTNFNNPHGLSDIGHYTTAYDMALMTQLAIQDEEFMKVFSTLEYEMPPTNLTNTRYFNNIDDSMHEDSFYYYEGMTGAKTGYTNNAQYTKVSVAKRGSRTLIAVVMGASSEVMAYKDSQLLLDYGFSEFYQKTLFVSDFNKFVVEVEDENLISGYSKVSLAQGVNYLVHINTDEYNIDFDVDMPDKITAQQMENTPYYLKISIPIQGLEEKSEVSALLSFEQVKINYFEKIEYDFLYFINGLKKEQRLFFIYFLVFIASVVLLKIIDILKGVKKGFEKYKENNFKY